MCNDKYFYNRFHIDKHLLLEFFVVFSQVEYALKNSGYASGDEKEVKADWDKFAKAISNKFDSNNNNEIKKAFEFYLRNPPKKQILINEKLDWKESIPTNGDCEKVLIYIRRTRNNLFHGGKVNSNDRERNSKLIENGVLLLKYAIYLEPEVEHHFN